jgi:L-ascorbate metabolism protein UlaG (beta-lactamase superfamily)
VAGNSRNKEVYSLDITYLGGGSVKLAGKQLSVLFDPIEGVRAKSDVVIFTANQESKIAGAEDVMVIDRPGEYEVKGAMITGVPAQLHIDEDGRRGSAFSVLIDGVNVVVVGNIASKIAADEVENLGQVDVLVVPVGGNGLTLDAEGAAAVVTQLEPSYVVPVHYDDGQTKYPVPQRKVEAFLNEMGASPEPEPKLRINQKEPPAETQVVLLSRAG